MTPELTRFGEEMSHLTGVRAIMKDIVETLRAGQGQHFINLSAGNPVILPEIEQLWRDCTQALLASPEYGNVVCRYGTSQGYEPLIEAIKHDFNQRYGLELSDRHILITPGSQALYFLAANALGGYQSTGRMKDIVLPLSPDYTGYGGISLVPEAVRAYRPAIDVDEAAHRFRYRPDFSQLSITADTGFVLFSRPCNPTGNVLSGEDVQQIASLAATHNVPVLVDSAYAPPYPALNFTAMEPVFGDNILHCMSLSKAGLPGERLGVAIGDPAIINVLECFQTNFCIHSSRYGQAIAARAIASGELARLAEQVIRPYYQDKFAVLAAALDQAMPSDLPWYLHNGEGAIFAWLWFDQLPITDQNLYEQLKQRGVIVVPGNPFFPGLREDWPHTRQCVRISLTASREDLAEAATRLGALVSEVYQAQPSPMAVPA
ncbi:valine--pyruvate transaminase [Phormidium tenue]|uniref:Valine--pyruvate transaminase n=1 Tax=Phormidium tenue NIES-30 TaxID=549789 RepID=A0A1U7JBF4_9CYAN|nr:valine--pyruvate transaminase [Phormidium tenue]MBD2230126.1 valine--pyruvate transaminase [Phormidium tenue FACHB-1052]OKH51042.1 valine--pyruvate transaminase [Phormidium tenue NIES-30]